MKINNFNIKNGYTTEQKKTYYLELCTWIIVNQDVDTNKLYNKEMKNIYNIINDFNNKHNIFEDRFIYDTIFKKNFKYYPDNSSGYKLDLFFYIKKEHQESDLEGHFYALSKLLANYVENNTDYVLNYEKLENLSQVY